MGAANRPYLPASYPWQNATASLKLMTIISLQVAI